MAAPTNQTDTRLREGGRSLGLVVSIGTDPNEKGRREDGRVKVRLFEQIGQSTVSDDDLTWYPVRHSSMSPGSRGMGSFPHGLTPGSVVSLDFDTVPGTGFITGVIPNAELNDQTQDMHPEATSTSLIAVIDEQIKKNGVDNYQELIWKNSEIGKLIYDVKSTEDALKILTGQAKTEFSKFKKDRIPEIVKNVRVPPEMGGAKGFKSARSRTPTTSGAVAHNKASVVNATKWAEQVLGQKGELIKNHYKMVETLKQKVKSGQIDDAISSIGGPKILGGAVNMIQQIVNFSNSGKEEKKKKEDEETLEEFLMKLYRRETGQEPLDANGNPTPQYIAWKKEYLAGEIV